MEKIREMIAYVFPVHISDRDGWLVIDDRRPEEALLLWVGALLLAILAAVFLAPPMVSEGYYWPIGLIVVGTLAVVYMLLRSAFRELYVFDKSRNSYVFTRQSVLRKETIEGDLRTFRAVQVEHTVKTDNEGHRSDEYRAVLLLDRSLLFGASPSQPLRFKSPIFSSYTAELRIASALSKYLGVRLDDEVDVAGFH